LHESYCGLILPSIQGFRSKHLDDRYHKSIGKQNFRCIPILLPYKTSYTRSN
jgi:hypothetical protein